MYLPGPRTPGRKRTDARLDRDERPLAKARRDEDLRGVPAGLTNARQGKDDEVLASTGQDEA